MRAIVDCLANVAVWCVGIVLVQHCCCYLSLVRRLYYRTTQCTYNNSNNIVARVTLSHNREITDQLQEVRNLPGNVVRPYPTSMERREKRS